MAINGRIVGQHLHLGRLVLVAPVCVSLDLVTALDLRLLQLPRGRGNHRQGEEKGQDHHQVELIHRWTVKWVVGGDRLERRLGRRERCATAGVWSCGFMVPPGGTGDDQVGPFKVGTIRFGP